MICPSCQSEWQKPVKFCPSCGTRIASKPQEVPSQQHSEHDHSNDTSQAHHQEPTDSAQQQDSASHQSQQGSAEGFQHIFQNFTDHVHRAAGFDGKVEIRLRDLFSETFKKHTEEDAEKLFVVGTSKTTPTMDQLIDTWPKPWLFMRIFIIVAIGYFGFYFGFSIFQNINLLPGLIMVGSFMVPLSLLVFFWEINAPQNIPIYRVVFFVLIAGLISLIIALLFFQTLGVLGQNVIFVGIIEESAKVLAILWCLRKRNYHFILNGLLVGAAVGTGFAAFESAGYALQGALTGMDTMLNTIHLRGLLAPGGHIVWAALSGAAICMVKGRQPWKWEMLKDMRFLRIFIIVTILHVIWNSPISGALFPVSYIILIVISWIIAFAMISVGLKEISTLKNQYIQERNAGLTTPNMLPGEFQPTSQGTDNQRPQGKSNTIDM